MAREWREEYKGGIYHVIARGNNKEYIFKEGIDKGYFIKQLKEYNDTMGYRVYGYVLMDNHYHIIIQTFDKKLQEIMHQINNKYSKYFNGKYNRVGHVFQGRYKAILVQDERYMLKLLRYVHQNPVRAGLCRLVEEYKWSSDIYYRENIKGFINTLIIYNMLDKDTIGAIHKYKEFMAEPEEMNYSTLKAIGDEAYVVLCMSRKEEKQRRRLDELLFDTGISLIEYEQIKSGSRKRKLTEYKLRYAIAAKEEHYTLKEIGEHIGMTAISIKNMLDRYET
ncbi:transposase [Lutispora saccharofermentans]|uniref:Transposase n=1 Tax=Lutispora saccharofermentans TaxID=3024236 RepID=A0ABT1NC11_9FIRM|nr:transposase [Lutispora saccharofermentans]MCQ1528792.1 transposase [Lutispora saccharofermentans]